MESKGACAEEDMKSEKEAGKAGEFLTERGCLCESSSGFIEGEGSSCLQCV